MRREKWTAAVQHNLAIGFEGIGGVIKRNAEQDADKEVCQSIQPQLQPRIIDHTSAFDEAAAEDTVIAFIQFLPVTNHVAAIVRLVGHHHDGSVPDHMIESAGNGTPESVRCGILHRSQTRNAALERFEHRPGFIRAAIVHYNDLMRHIVEPKFDVEMLDGRYDAALFISSWDNHREQLQRRCADKCNTHAQPETSSHSGWA